MKFATAAYKTTEGRWNGQVLLDGIVILEDDTGSISEGTAICNARSSFAYLLQTAIAREDALQHATAEPSDVDEEQAAWVECFRKALLEVNASPVAS